MLSIHCTRHVLRLKVYVKGYNNLFEKIRHKFVIFKYSRKRYYVSFRIVESVAGAAGNTFRTWPSCAESFDVQYMATLDTHPITPSRAPNPAISMECGNFTFTDVSVTPGFISFTLSKASGTFKFAAATLQIRIDSTITKRNEVN